MPFPKSQLQEVGLLVELSKKFTFKGKQPDWGVAVKSATGCADKKLLISKHSPKRYFLLVRIVCNIWEFIIETNSKVGKSFKSLHYGLTNKGLTNTFILM